jgi:sec-independent protein translocase protein TatA
MKKSTIFAVVATFLSNTEAFAPARQPLLNRAINTNTLQQTIPVAEKPLAIQKQRYSMAQIQTMSLFGLGAPELAIILIAAAFLLGPQKLAELGKDAGKIAGELKEVPKEFQKGLAEGEMEAKKMKKEIAPERSDDKGNE